LQIFFAFFIIIGLMAYQTDSSLNAKDWLILEELQKNARVSFAELGRLVKMSRPAVTERVKRLEDAGVISGYGVKINLSKVGLPITAFMRLRGACNKSMSVFETIPEIIACDRVTGDDDFIAKLAVSSIAHLEDLINRLEPICEITTLIVLNEVVKERLINPSLLAQE